MILEAEFRYKLRVHIYCLIIEKEIHLFIAIINEYLCDKL